jgi:drug/metabolite transporter (DMT)-like permease
MVAAGAWLAFGERISRHRWPALPLVMLGLVLLIRGDLEVLAPDALMFGLASAFFYSAYILAASRWLRHTDSLVAATYIQLAAGTTLSLMYWRDLSRFSQVLKENWLLLAGVALIGSVLAMSLFLAGLRRLKNWEVSVLSTSEPVMAILLAMVLLRESLSLTQILGALCVLGAFVLVARPLKN